MILYINDPDLVQRLVDAEREDWADQCLADSSKPRTWDNLEEAARAVFALSGNPVPANAIFKPRLWLDLANPGKCAITTTPGERPGT